MFQLLARHAVKKDTSNTELLRDLTTQGCVQHVTVRKITTRGGEMREIKFRAWDKETQEMCQVTRLMWNQGRFTEPMHKLTHVSCNGVQMLYNANTYELMQFTGLLDKNGKEIYEEDIVTIKTWFRDNEVDKICITVMDGWQSVFEAARNTEDGFYCPMGSIAQNDREVIGNIYENPELLEGQA